MDIDLAKKTKGFTRHTPYINFICKQMLQGVEKKSKKSS